MNIKMIDNKFELCFLLVKYKMNSFKLFGLKRKLVVL